jgi:hypothetical protein
MTFELTVIALLLALFIYDGIEYLARLVKEMQEDRLNKEHQKIFWSLQKHVL